MEKKSKGGANTHKNPNCICSPCTARRKREQSIQLSQWAKGNTDTEAPGPRDAINADMPIVVAETDTPKARVARWLELRTQDPDISITEAARVMRIGRRVLNASIQTAVEEGWLRFEDPLAKIEYQIIPKVVRNLNKFLDEGDKTVTIETAKGTLFKMYQESKGISDTPQTVLALKIEQPALESSPKIITGHVVGKPRSISTEG